MTPRYNSSQSETTRAETWGVVFTPCLAQPQSRGGRPQYHSPPDCSKSGSPYIHVTQNTCFAQHHIQLVQGVGSRPAR